MQPYYGNTSITIPYMRKDTSSTLLAFSAIALLLLASPLLLSNVLVQPAQAQTTLSFRTPTPANGDSGTLTFDAQGTTSTSDPSSVDITNGTIQWQTDQTYTGEIYSGSFNNNTRGGAISFNAKINNLDSSVSSPCRTVDSNSITLTYQNGRYEFNGPVECSSSQGGGNTASSSMTGTAQDSDGDGIPDSSDNCSHNSNPRCFKESTNS
jgi:Thrombospondin type 3 repeat